MLFLGIDPGVRKLGYALIDETKDIKEAGILLQDTAKPTRLDYFKKMVHIEAFFIALLEKNSITAVGIEQLFFTSHNQANAEFVYGIRGILATLCIKHSLMLHEYTPIQLKKNITGNGKAPKERVQLVIQRLFCLDRFPEFDDAADALGLAYLAMRKTSL